MGTITWKGKTIRGPICSSNGQESRYLTEFSEIGVIAMGGFGIVAKCKNKLDKKEYAIKKISLKYAQMSLEKLLREVDVISSMKHPNIVQYYQTWFESMMSGCTCGPPPDARDADSWDDGWESNAKGLSKEDIESPCLYILMELCSSSLGQFLKNTSASIEEVARDIFCQVLRGLGHIHEQGFVHGDLSLANLFVDRDRIVKIGDFGLARKTDDDGYLCSNSDGVKIYKAPENVPGRKVNFKIDMFSLGVVFAEILHHPFDSDDERAEVLLRVRKDGAPTHFENDLVSVINSLVSEDPTKRPTVAEVLAKLENMYKEEITICYVDDKVACLED